MIRTICHLKNMFLELNLNRCAGSGKTFTQALNDAIKDNGGLKKDFAESIWFGEKEKICMMVEFDDIERFVSAHQDIDSVVRDFEKRRSV